MKRIFEYQCSKGHRHEAYSDYDAKLHQCPECEELAERVISTPRIGLEGVTGAFPSASDKWARKHEEASKVAKKRIQEHGRPSRLFGNV